MQEEFNFFAEIKQFKQQIFNQGGLTEFTQALNSNDPMPFPGAVSIKTALTYTDLMDRIEEENPLLEIPPFTLLDYIEYVRYRELYKLHVRSLGRRRPLRKPEMPEATQRLLKFLNRDEIEII